MSADREGDLLKCDAGSGTSRLGAGGQVSPPPFFFTGNIFFNPGSGSWGQSKAGL